MGFGSCEDSLRVPLVCLDEDEEAAVDCCDLAKTKKSYQTYLTDDEAIILVGGFAIMAILLMLGHWLFCEPQAPRAIHLTYLHEVPEGHAPKGHYLNYCQTTLQLKQQIRDIPCNSKGGVVINFEKIEVLSQLKREYVYERYGKDCDNATIYDKFHHEISKLYNKTFIYDKIHHEVNKFCSNRSIQQIYIDQFDEIDEKMRDALQGDCTSDAPHIKIINVQVTKPTILESIMCNFEGKEEECTNVMMLQWTPQKKAVNFYRTMKEA